MLCNASVTDTVAHTLTVPLTVICRSAGQGVGQKGAHCCAGRRRIQPILQNVTLHLIWDTLLHNICPTGVALILDRYFEESMLSQVQGNP